MIEGEVIETTAMIHREERPPELRDMRELILRADSQQIEGSLAEYDRRRKTWRDWLLSNLQEGVHYGFQPGRAPQWCDLSGYDCTEDVATATKTKSYKTGKVTIMPLSQWRPKRTFFKAGAHAVIELMNVRAEYSADMDAWKQLGEPKETFVRKCRLFSRATGEFIGEGSGAAKLSDNDGSANKAIKMADKSADIAAVLNAYSLSDLFSQPVDESMLPPEHENPTSRPDAPVAPPRDERGVSRDDCAAVFKEWKVLRQRLGESFAKEAFETWVDEITGVGVSKVADYRNWIPDDLRKLREDIAAQNGATP